MRCRQVSCPTLPQPERHRRFETTDRLLEAASADPTRSPRCLSPSVYAVVQDHDGTAHPPAPGRSVTTADI